MTEISLWDFKIMNLISRHYFVRWEMSEGHQEPCGMLPIGDLLERLFSEDGCAGVGCARDRCNGITIWMFDADLLPISFTMELRFFFE